MAELNGMLKRADEARNKALEAIDALFLYSSKVSSEVASRFRDEYREAGSTTGLEDFYALNNVLRKNLINAKQARELLRRMKSTEGYDISEEEIVEQQLEKIFDKKVPA